MINKELWQTRLNKMLDYIKVETNKIKIKIIEKKIKNYRDKLQSIEPIDEPIKKTIDNPITKQIDKPIKKQINRQINDSRIEYNCLDKYKYNNEELFMMLKNSVEKFYLNGPRSTAKLNVLHSFINCIVAYKLKELNNEIYKDISIYSHPVKELKISGLIYNKNTDITIKYKSHVIGIISVKFIMSNYSQNNINYLETMIGECINLKSVKHKRVFWQPIFILKNVPYYDNKNNIKKNETIKFNKYDKLYNYIIKNKEKHTLLPDFISITILNNKNNMEHPNNVDKKDITKYLNELFNISNPILELEDDKYDFFNNLDDYCNKIIKNIIDKYINHKHFDSFASSTISNV